MLSKPALGGQAITRSHLKNRILVQVSFFTKRLRRTGAAGPRFPRCAGFPIGFIPLRVKTGGILPYFEDLKRGTNKMKLIRLWRVGPKDIFEIASKYITKP
jgi:hypothetical protein